MFKTEPFGRAFADRETEAAPFGACRVFAEMDPRTVGCILCRALFIAHETVSSLAPPKIGEFGRQ